MRAAQRRGGWGRACARERGQTVKNETSEQLARLKRGVESISQGSLASVSSAVAQPARTPALPHGNSSAPLSVAADLQLATSTPGHHLQVRASVGPLIEQGADGTRGADDGAARGAGAGGGAEVKAEGIRQHSGGFCAAGVEANGGASLNRVLGIDGSTRAVQWSLISLSASSDLEEQNGLSVGMRQASAKKERRRRRGPEKVEVSGEIVTI